MRFTLRTVFILVTICSVACAGFARWYGSRRLALDGFCPVTLNDGEKWVAGDPRFQSVYGHSRFYFRSTAEKRRFDRSPADYAPVSNGADIVVAFETGRRARGHRAHGVWYRGRVLLFASEASLARFAERPEFFWRHLVSSGEVPGDLQVSTTVLPTDEPERNRWAR